MAGGKKKGPKKPGTAVKLACVGEIELGTGSEIYCIEIPRPLRKKKKKRAARQLRYFTGREGREGCSAGDTPGREGPARSVTVQRVRGVSPAALHRPAASASAGASSWALFSSWYLYITAGSVFFGSNT